MATKNRMDYAPLEVQRAMQGKPHRHDLCRQITEKVMGLRAGTGINRPGKTRADAARKGHKHA